MTVTRLRELAFVDLVLGVDYCDAKRQTATVHQLIDVLSVCPDDVAALRKQCLDKQKECAEFTVEHDGMRFRATTMHEPAGPVWFLSRVDAQVRELSQLPAPEPVVRLMLQPRLQGLVLVTGGFGAGKTTLASSLFCHRIHQLGGTGIALEDPMGEVQMAGRRGQGRILQVPVSAYSGGYHEALLLVRRSRADMVFIGEIRDATTATEAQDIANADMPVIATMHASSIEEALDKYQAYLRSRNASSQEANARLAMTVACVVHLTKHYVNAPDGTPVPTFVPRALILDRADPLCAGALGKIRDGNFTGLADDIAMQASRRIRGN